jgi:hypothetical protein
MPMRGSGIRHQGWSPVDPLAPLFSSFSGGLLGSSSGSGLGLGSRVGERVALETGVVVDPGNVADDAAEQ